MDDFNNQNNNESGGFNVNTEGFGNNTESGSYQNKNSDFYGHFNDPTHNYYSSDNNNYYSVPKKPKAKHSTATVIISAVLAALIGATTAFAGIFTYIKNNGNSNSASQNKQNVTIDVSEVSSSVAEAVAKKATPSVVGIRTTTSVMNFFGGNQEQTGSGSGVVYSADGYIITNYHVIESAVKSNNPKIDVFLSSEDENSYPATVVGYHISSDLAVLKINANNLQPAELGDSSKLNVGQYVITIGAPGGLEFMGSVTYGIISGLNRVVSTTNSVSLIQTDAAINPGNSGGALLDCEGKLIGINSSKIVSEEFEGMGFAIPVNTVKEKCDKIIAKKDVPEAYIGVSISEKYTPDVLQFYGYPVGAVVLSVDDASPAAEAGIKRGDIITEFNGVAISSYTLLGEAINDCDPGQTVEVKIYRNGNIGSVQVKVGSAGSNH